MSTGAVVTSAVMARQVDYGEADRICTLLTRRLGKVSVLAKSARRSRRRFGAALGLFVRGDAVLHPPTRGELYRLERFDSQEDLGMALAADLTKMAHGSYILEVARDLWPVEQREVRLFDLVWEALCLLARTPGGSASLLRAYELKLLTIMGFAPNWAHCTRCGTASASSPPAEAEAGFSANLGGIVCASCGGGEGHLRLDSTTLAYLRALAQRPLDDALDMALDARRAALVREMLTQVLVLHLSRQPQTLAFIGKVNAAARNEHTGIAANRQSDD